MIDPSNHPFECCAHCGSSFRHEESYPVVTRHEDGLLQFYSFCDESCRDAWRSGDAHSED